MMDARYNDIFGPLAQDFADYLGETYPRDLPGLLGAMSYSLRAGGKRFRPLLFLLAAKTYQAGVSVLYPFALAIEMIHTYSLIHDDLPAMDDDDFRRGLPTCHKTYGEALAILAGDALLTDAFRAMTSLRHQVDEGRLLWAIEEMSLNAGSGGMVEGQVRDIDAEGRTLDEAELRAIHELKTGALIRSSLVCGAILGGAPEGEIEAFRAYGSQLGLVFQIADDILDREGDFAKLGKATGSDEKKHKTTYYTLWGPQGARDQGEAAIAEGKRALAGIARDTTAFAQLLEYAFRREN